MNNINFMYLMDQIDDKYIVEAKMLPRPKREFWATSRLTSFFSDAMTVAATIIVFGALIIWSLVGKDLLTKDKGYDTTPTDAVTTPIITTEPDKEPDDPIVYSEGLKFELNEEKDGYKVVGVGTCQEAVINIPPTYNGLPVTEIGPLAFYTNCSCIVEVNIPHGVEAIRSSAFLECLGLQKITIPDSVTVIQPSAFQNCDSLTEIKIPNGVTSIHSVFVGCDALKKVELPSSLTKIDDYAFSGCKSLETVNIPESITEIGAYAFSGCASLKQITIPGSVVSIGYSAFGSCTNLEKLTMNNGLEMIDQYAFENCTALTSVTVPDSVTRIGKFAFSNCTSITSIKLPFVGAEEGADEMSTRKFGYIFGEGSNQSTLPTSLKTVEITKATSIPDSAFLGCDKLTSVVLHESVTSIETMAFYGCKNLTNIEIRGDLTFIGMESFFGCLALKEIVIPKSVVYIDNNAFEGNQLTIYCEISSQPTTWHKDWNRFNLTVVWGYTGDKS